MNFGPAGAPIPSMIFATADHPLSVKEGKSPAMIYFSETFS
jgi:hypothetical protein